MSTTLLIAISLIFSTLLCFFTNSWLVVWVLLEVNTLSFCSIAATNTEMNATNVNESLINYLVVQSIASAMLITAGCVNETSNTFSPMLLLIITIALLIKIAAVPFHYWFIQVSKNLSWLNNNILFTWQNILPIYLITFQTSNLLFLFIAASVFWGSVFLVNNKSFNEILALSSVFNLGWLLLAVTLSVNILLVFAAIYWTSLIFFIEEISNDKADNFNENVSKFSNASLFLNTINLAGIPPLMMFTANWLTFSSILAVNILLLASFVLIISSVNIFIYLRTASTAILQNSNNEQNTNTSIMSLNEIVFLGGNLLILQLFL